MRRHNHVMDALAKWTKKLGKPTRAEQEDTQWIDPETHKNAISEVVM